ASQEFELAGLGVAELAAGMAEGRWTAERLVELYSGRIEALDRAPGGTNAVAELNPDAAAIAAELDRERREGRVRGPLHGIPVLLKDNLDTGDRMLTAAGSLALADAPAPADAFTAARLREAGAVILGKTNLSEWANFRSTRSTSGWSGRGGQVHNPYALDRNPCGSSSGSGVAPSADLCAAAVGTETDGSVTCPASMNGIVGLKPTVGLVSRSGIVPISHTQDTAGPMGRTVEDVAILLGGMVGVDARDSASVESAGRGSADYRSALSPDALRGARLGVARNFFGWHPEIDARMEEILVALRGLGAELVDPAEIPHAKDYDDAEYEVLLYEFKHDLNAYLATRPDGDRPRTLAALIEFNRKHAEREMPWFGQEIFELAEAKGPLTEPAYLDALEKCRRLSRAEGIDQVLAEHRLDALVCPSMGPAYLTDWINGDHYGGSATSPPAVSGYPHLTVPAGFVHGLPWGLSWIGPAWSEAKLLAYGHAFERATRARRAPRFLPSVDFGVPA
ncbi:MAG TPA: amidase, partial [Thermoanaerobaculia bacterium]|nr:amidase [Thermoanaerobaculia bacterium]